MESDQTTFKKEGLWEHQVILKCCQILTEHCMFSTPMGAG